MMNNYISSVAVLMTGMFLLSAHVTADNAPEGVLGEFLNHAAIGV